jgi:hypothetical protein
MRRNVTYVWGQVTDPIGLIHRTSYRSLSMPGGSIRAWKEDSFTREPASAYARVHPAPMPMRWSHKDKIGRVVALGRRDDRLYAVAECEELTPDDLQGLADEYGELRWSTGTSNRRNEPLRITEISLTSNPATVGLWPVKWYRLDSSRGNLPMWVREALARAEKTEYRSRRELVVHETRPATNTAAEYAELERYFRSHPGEVYHAGVTGDVLTVGGKPVRR